MHIILFAFVGLLGSQAAAGEFAHLKLKNEVESALKNEVKSANKALTAREQSIYLSTLIKLKNEAPIADPRIKTGICDSTRDKFTETLSGLKCSAFGVTRGCAKKVGGKGCYCDTHSAVREQCPYACNECDMPCKDRSIGDANYPWKYSCIAFGVKRGCSAKVGGPGCYCDSFQLFRDQCAHSCNQCGTFEDDYGEYSDMDTDDNFDGLALWDKLANDKNARSKSTSQKKAMRCLRDRCKHELKLCEEKCTTVIGWADWWVAGTDRSPHQIKFEDKLVGTDVGAWGLRKGEGRALLYSCLAAAKGCL